MTPQYGSVEEAPSQDHTGTEPVRVSVLGGFGVRMGSRIVGEDGWRLRKAAALVKLLALAPGRRLHRDQALDLLWPEQGREAGARNLYQALHVARGILGGEGPDGPQRLRLRDEWISLHPPEAFRVDVDVFEDAAREARREATPGAYGRAISLYGGELLPGDRYEPWAEARRAELRETYLDLLVELARLYERRGEVGPAIEALRQATAEDPAREEVHVALMRAYARSGQRYQALRQYGRLGDTLRRELGVEPDAASRRLYEDILAGHPIGTTLPEDRPTGEPGLPRPLTTFVGRGREKEELARLLGANRLLTLVGTGGSGKTRLALEVAREGAKAFPDGVRFVDLAPLSDPGLVPQAVAEAIPVYEQPNRPVADMLVEALGGRRMLLVLDNCEHLVEACARLAERLLASCPELRILSTGREHLGAASEVTWRVPPLSTPDPLDDEDPNTLLRHESVRLFVARAQYRSPDFVLTERNARAVAEICHRLDGIPLALELAANRLGTLSVEQIPSRLDDALGLLADGLRTTAPRQQTLRRTLDWSYALLTPPEKALLDRLSVFAGSWTLEAAEVVGADAGGEIEAREVLDLLAHLVDKSLVVADASVPVRFRLAGFVRQYARERLEAAGEATPTRRRHARLYLELAERGERGLATPDQGLWLERLEREHPNFRAALEWTLDTPGEEETGLCLAAALWSFWETRGHLVEGRGWLKRAARQGRPAATLAKALNGAGYIALFQGDYDAAVASLEEALVLYRKLGSPEGVAACLTNLGLVAVIGMRFDLPVADLLEEAMSLRPKIEDPRTLGNLLVLAGMLTEAPDATDVEMPMLEESLALLRATRDTRGVSLCLTTLGFSALEKGDVARATALLEENLHVSRGLDKKYCIAYSLFGLANVAHALGLPARALRLWAAAQSVRRAAGIELSPLARSSTRYEARLAEARAVLGDAASGQAWDEGESMDQEIAIEYALSHEADEPRPAARSPLEPAPALTPREREVAALVAEGLSNRRVARQLEIAERTVTTHVARILKKLDLRSRAQLAAAWKNGDVQGTPRTPDDLPGGRAYQSRPSASR